MLDFETEITEIHSQIKGFLADGKKVFTSSSFQSHSIPLLHIISKVGANIPVYFLNTGFHFSETVRFKNKIAEDFGLTIIDIESPIAKNVQRNSKGHFHFVDKPDYCCYLNKVLPIEPILLQYDVWIAGVRADQSATRGNMAKTQEGKHGVLRYHPILNWDKKAIWKSKVDRAICRQGARRQNRHLGNHSLAKGL